MPRLRKISIDEMDQFQLDEHNRLYWQGSPVLLEQRLRLAPWVNVAVILGAVSTTVIAAIEVLRYFQL